MPYPDLTPALDRATRVLTELGYRRRHVPLHVAEVPFRFAAAFEEPVPTGHSDEDGCGALVLLVDGTGQGWSARALVRRVRNLRHVLSAGDRGGRPVTVLLDAEVSTRDDWLDALQRQCRVVWASSEDEALRTALGPLPLSSLAQSGDPLREMRRLLGDDASSPVGARLLAATKDGAAAVTTELKRLIDEAVDPGTEGKQP